MVKRILSVIAVVVQGLCVSMADTNRFPVAGTPIDIVNPNPALCLGFGQSAARFDENRFIVGGGLKSEVFVARGAAFLFDNDGTLLLSIPNPMLNTSSGFGAAVAPFGQDRILVGDDALDRAYLFNTNGTLLAMFQDPSTNGFGQTFGESMSQLGFDRVALGDSGDANGSGVVYIFDTNATLIAQITDPVTTVGFSANVAWGGDIAPAGLGRVVVGGGSGSLASHVIDRDGNVQATFRKPTDSTTGAFGRSVAQLTESTFIAADTESNSGYGGAYLFHTNGALLVSYASRLSGAMAGASMTALGIDNLAVGAPDYSSGNVDGAVLLFNASGGEPAELLGESTNSTTFGSSLAAISTNTLLVGVSGFDGKKGRIRLYPLTFSFPDVHEPDDSSQLAAPFRIGTNETHTLHRPGDEDWVSFFALSNLSYTIKADNVATNIDIAIDVFRRGLGGFLTPVVLQHNEFGFGGDEHLVLTNLVTGAHVVRYYAAPPPFGGQFPKSQARAVATDYGDDAEYDIVILGPTPTALLVIVVDLLSENGESSPPNTVVTIDGNAPVAVVGNVLQVNGLSAGIHTVSVSVAAGYLGDQDPAEANQINNPENILFGNPRHVEVLGAGMSFAPFAYLPIAAIDADVRDALTGGPAEDVDLTFVAIGGILAGLTNNAYPLGAIYAQPWITPPSGAFPTNVMIPSTNWVLTLSGSGYVSQVIFNGLTALSAGDEVELNDIFMVPLDLNSNGISDAWEQLHFATNITGIGDADMDGLSDAEEYLVGTDPTNATSRFAFDPAATPGTNGVISFCWPVFQGRTYSLSTIDDLTTTNWVLGVGPWVAPSNGVYCWSDAESTNVASRTYRVDVLLP